MALEPLPQRPNSLEFGRFPHVQGLVITSFIQLIHGWGGGSTQAVLKAPHGTPQPTLTTGNFLILEYKTLLE